jgi:hypothetical protein
MADRYNTPIDLPELSSAPASPGSGYHRFYAKTDGKPYSKSAAGVEYDLSDGGGGGGLTLTQVTKTLTTGAWTLVSGLYEQDVSDAAITSVAVVDIIPDNADITTVKDAEILPKTVSASGSVKVYATNLPSADIGVTLNILK